jgi:hypothetical protein
MSMDVSRPHAVGAVAGAIPVLEQGRIADLIEAHQRAWQSYLVLSDKERTDASDATDAVLQEAYAPVCALEDELSVAHATTLSELMSLLRYEREARERKDGRNMFVPEQMPEQMANFLRSLEISLTRIAGFPTSIERELSANAYQTGDRC